MKKLLQNKEMLVGIIFLIIGVVYFALAFTIPIYDAYGGSSVVDSSFVPKVVGILLIVLSILQLIFSSKAAKNAPAAQPTQASEEDEEFKVEDWDDDAANRNADTIYMALLSTLGFMISSVLFLIATMLLLTPAEKRNIPLILILSVVVSVGVYYLFVYGLDMVLPRGILG